MKRVAQFTFTVLVFALPLAAQKEFLTNDEIEKIREAQEPNLRLKTYLLIAKQRMRSLESGSNGRKSLTWVSARYEGRWIPIL